MSHHRCTFTKSARARDKRGVDLISDALPFGRLWYGEPMPSRTQLDTPNTAVDHIMLGFRVYNAAGNVIEPHEHKSDFTEWGIKVNGAIDWRSRGVLSGRKSHQWHHRQVGNSTVICLRVKKGSLDRSNKSWIYAAGNAVAIPCEVESRAVWTATGRCCCREVRKPQASCCLGTRPRFPSSGAFRKSKKLQRRTDSSNSQAFDWDSHNIGIGGGGFPQGVHSTNRFRIYG